MRQGQPLAYHPRVAAPQRTVLTFLGAGSAFTVVEGSYQSNVLLETPSGRRLLIDCGSDARRSLARLGLGAADVPDIYISHLHADHIGGLEHLGLSTAFDPRCARPRLWIPEPLIEPLWSRCLAGGMGIVQPCVADLDFYFDVHALAPDAVFDFDGVRVELVPTLHVPGAAEDMFSYGLALDAGGPRTYLTTDTSFQPEALRAHYEAADTILHDCETSPFKTGVHPHFEELLTLPEAIRARTWLYHYNDGDKPDAVAAGFRGWVQTGQRFEIGPTGDEAR